MDGVLEKPSMEADKETGVVNIMVRKCTRTSPKSQAISEFHQGFAPDHSTSPLLVGFKRKTEGKDPHTCTAKGAMGLEQV